MFSSARLSCERRVKLVAAGRRNQHARRVRYPEGSRLRRPVRNPASEFGLKRAISAIRSQAEQVFLQPGRLVGGESAFDQMLKRFDTAVWNSPLLVHSHP